MERGLSWWRFSVELGLQGWRPSGVLASIRAAAAAVAAAKEENDQDTTINSRRSPQCRAMIHASRSGLCTRHTLTATIMSTTTMKRRGGQHGQIEETKICKKWKRQMLSRWYMYDCKEKMVNHPTYLVTVQHQTINLFCRVFLGTC